MKKACILTFTINYISTSLNILNISRLTLFIKYGATLFSKLILKKSNEASGFSISYASRAFVPFIIIFNKLYVKKYYYYLT